MPISMKYRKITIPAHYIDEDLTDFTLPVHIKNNTVGLVGILDTISNPKYVAFTDDLLWSNEYPATIGYFDTSGTSVWYVKIPSILAASGAEFYMWYGGDMYENTDYIKYPYDSGASNCLDGNVSRMYDFNYSPDDGSGNISTIYDIAENYDGSAVGSIPTSRQGNSTQFGRYLLFTGTSGQYIDCGTDALGISSEFTFIFDIVPTGYYRLFAKHASPNYGFHVTSSTSSNLEYGVSSDGSAWFNKTATSVFGSAPSSIVYDGVDIRVYNASGDLRKTDIYSSGLNDDSQEFRIGSSAAFDYPLYGSCNFLRIDTVARSAAYLKAFSNLVFQPLAGSATNFLYAGTETDGEKPDAPITSYQEIREEFVFKATVEGVEVPLNSLSFRSRIEMKDSNGDLLPPWTAATDPFTDPDYDDTQCRYRYFVNAGSPSFNSLSTLTDAVTNGYSLDVDVATQKIDGEYSYSDFALATIESATPSDGADKQSIAIYCEDEELVVDTTWSYEEVELTDVTFSQSLADGKSQITFPGFYAGLQVGYTVTYGSNSFVVGDMTITVSSSGITTRLVEY